MSERPSWAAEAALLVTVVAVTVAFSPSWRTFSALKEGLLLVGAGAAVLGLAADGLAVRWGALVVGLPLLTWPLWPTADGVLASAYLAALAAVGVASGSLPRERWGLALGVGLGIGAALTAAQALGVGVLPATAESFGGVHGVLVGTVGNPNENAWALLLGGLVVAGAGRRRLGWALVAAGLAVAMGNRSRAAAGAAALVLPLLVVPGRWRWGAAAVSASLGAVAVWAWGGLEALAGRAVLLRIAAHMVVERRGLPAGPGAFARDHAPAQAAWLAGHPGDAHAWSILEHAHCDLLELAYELGPLALVWVGLAGVLARRLPREAAAALALGGGLSLVGYPLFSPAPALALALAWGSGLTSDRTGTLARGALGLAGMALVVVGGASLRSEHDLAGARAALAAGQDELAVEHALRAPLVTGSVAYTQGAVAARAGAVELAVDRWEASWDLRPVSQTAEALAEAHAVLGDEAEAELWRGRAAQLAEPGSSR